MAELNSITADSVRENLHYDPDTGVFTWKTNRTGTAKQGSIAGSFKKGGYRQILVCGKRLMEHRLAFLFMTGKFPDYDVDHINGVKDDNKWSNLRDVRTAINMQNQINAFSTKKNRLIGAYWHKRCNKWQACIMTNGRLKHIGYFLTEQEAHEAYINAKRVVHKDGFVEGRLATDNLKAAIGRIGRKAA